MHKPDKPRQKINTKRRERVYTMREALNYMEQYKLDPEKVELERDDCNRICLCWYDEKDNPDYDFYMKRYEEDLQRYKAELQQLIDDADKE